MRTATVRVNGRIANHASKPPQVRTRLRGEGAYPLRVHADRGTDSRRFDCVRSAADGSIVQQPIGSGPVAVVSSGPLEVLYASDAPDAVLGLSQVNFRLPATAPGPWVSVAVQSASATSDYVAIHVKAP
jgi:hypothetical protein